MTNSNIILDSLKDFQLELDKRNSNALLELNKHIDELATIPINTDLPLYSDSIEFISPPKGFADASSPTRNEDLSWQLRQDLEEFQKLSNNDFIPESRRESEDKSNNYNGYGAPSAPLEGLYIPQSFTSSSPLNTQYQPKLSSPINQNSHLLDNFDYNVERLSKSSNNIDTQNTTNSRAHSMENNYQSPCRNELDNEKIHTSYSKGYLSDRNIPVDQNNSAADAKLMNGSYRGDPHRNSFQNNEAVNSQFDLKSNNGYTSSIQNMNNAHISQDIYGSMVNNYNSLPSLNKKENPNYDPMSDFTNKLERIQNLQSPIQNHNTKLNRNSPQNSNFREEKLDLIDLDVGNQFSDVSSPFKPTEFLAEDNSRSIVNALRTLQDRVGKLEGEKLLAKEKINELENELLATRRLLYHKQKEGNPILMNDSTINPHFAKKELQDSSKLPVPQSTTDDTLNDIAEARKRVNELRKTVNRAGVYDNFNENTEMTDPSIDPILKGYQDVNDLYNSGPKLTTEDLKAKVVQQNRQTKGESDQDKLDDSVRRRSSIRNRESTRSRSINGRNSATQKRVSTEIPSPSQLDEVAKIQEWDTIKNNIKNVIAESKLNKKRQDQPVEMSQQVENVLDRPKSPLKSQQLNSKPNKEFINANNEMKKLHDDIEAEKNLRRMMISDLPKDFSSKEKIATKKKAETLKDSPSWKKSDRRSRSTFRDHTLSSSAHIRKRGPLEVPGVGLSEDNAGREMPFIVGKNTGKSFSVTANLQRVFSLLKAHNPDMCSICSKRQAPSCKNKDHFLSTGRPVHVLEGHDLTKRDSDKPKKKQSLSNKPLIDLNDSETSTDHNVLKTRIATSSNESLQHVLGVLETEFKTARNEYNALVKQYETIAESMTSNTISQSNGTQTLKAIGDDLRHVIQSMETKSDQISILRDIVTSSMTSNGSKKSERQKKKIPKRYEMDTITSRSRSKDTLPMKPQKLNYDDPDLQPVWAHRRVRSQSPGRAMASLSLLKSSFKVQDALGDMIS